MKKIRFDLLDVAYFASGLLVEYVLILLILDKLTTVGVLTIAVFVLFIVLAVILWRKSA